MIVGQSGNRPTIPTKTRQIDYMHLKLLLPDVKTAEFSQPKKCPRAGCAGMRFYPRSFREACKTRTSGISREIVICAFVIFFIRFSQTQPAFLPRFYLFSYPYIWWLSRQLHFIQIKLNKRLFINSPYAAKQTGLSSRSLA